jgi:hypothetical protein
MKRFLVLIMSLTMVFSLVGCGPTKGDVEALEKEIAELESYKASLEEEISDIKEENNIHDHVVELTVKQSHFTLDLGTHFKDAMNELVFEVPVSEEFYNSVEVGDVLEDDFRMASVVLKGSFGSWKVKITNKYMK